MNELINELLERNGGDERSCLAWCIGYIDRLERNENTIRAALFAVAQQFVVKRMESENE